VTPPAACVAGARPAGGGVFPSPFLPAVDPVVLSDARRARSSARVRPAPLRAVRAPGGGRGAPLMIGRACHRTECCSRVDRRCSVCRRRRADGRRRPPRRPRRVNVCGRRRGGHRAAAGAPLPQALAATTVAAKPAAARLAATAQWRVQSGAAGAGRWRPPQRAPIVLPAAAGGSGGGGGSAGGGGGDDGGGGGVRAWHPPTGPVEAVPRLPSRHSDDRSRDDGVAGVWLGGGATVGRLVGWAARSTGGC